MLKMILVQKQYKILTILFNKNYNLKWKDKTLTIEQEMKIHLKMR